MSDLHDVVIVSAVRTPVGKLGGALASVRPDDLAALVIAEAVSRAGVPPGEIEEVFMGCANQAGEDNRDIARMALLLAGLPQHVGGVTINRLCASSLTAVNQAARAIRSGEGEIYVAGGVESMSRAPYAMPKAEKAYPAGSVTAWDTSLGWRFPNPRMEALFPLEGMGETAENIRERAERGEIAGGPISREDQDRFALQSHARVVRAMNEGWFKDQMVPVPIPQRKGEPLLVDADEHPRYRRTERGFELDTSLEQLARLRPAFRKGGTVTAGNASGMNDGAAALVLMSAAKARSLGIKALARWVSSGATGVDPRIMGMGPVDATRKALKRAGISIEQLDLVELNEAFAVQVLAVLHELGISEEKTNVNGGAVALGHPLGASGARILTVLVHEMRRRSAAGERMRYGLATACVGVGQGDAIVIELLP